MFEWEQKSKAQKIPGPKIDPAKNPIHNYAAGISGQTRNNNFQLNQAIRQNFCQIFLSYPKKIPKSKISNPKTPSIKPVTWNPEYHWGLVPPQFLNRKFCLWRTSLHQNRLSNTKLTRRDLRVNRKQPRNQVSSIFWKPKYTQLENEEPSTPVKGPAII